jgi:hypothetical protein
LQLANCTWGAGSFVFSKPRAYSGWHTCRARKLEELLTVFPLFCGDGDVEAPPGGEVLLAETGKLLR